VNRGQFVTDALRLFGRVGTENDMLTDWSF